MQNTQKTSWGGVADWYHALLESEDGTYQKDVILPNIVRLLGDVQNKSVLDLACGPGFFVREYWRGGAKVIGIDISGELIELGKKTLSKEKISGSKPVEWIVSNAETIPMVPNASIDSITIILALQNIERISAVFKECARVLKPTGRLFMVLNHPAYRIPKESDWGWDDEKQVQFRRVDKYLSEAKIKIDMHPGESQKEYTVSFHRPLQVYFKNLANAGLCVTRLEEWISNRQGPKGKRFAASEQARKEIPLFLCLEAKRVSL